MAQQNKQTREAPTLTVRASVEPSSLKVEERTVDVTWSTGAAVERRDWNTGERYSEVLSMNPGHIDLVRLNAGAPVLDSHRSGSTSNVLAAVVPGTAKTDGKKGSATIRFSRRPEADAAFQDVKDGILRNLSVGYVVHRFEVRKAEKGKIEERTATSWTPYEISLVGIPADVGAQVRAQDDDLPRGAQQRTNDMATILSEEALAERARVVAINELCRIHGIDDSKRDAWLADGAQVDDVREGVLALLSHRQAASHIRPGDGGFQREGAMVRDAADALARRAGVKVEGDGHRHFGDARLMDIAKRVLEAGGVNTRTLSGNDIAKRALSSSDFSSILALAGDKIVRNSYSAIPLAHREVLRRTTAVDFRLKHALSNASAGVLPEVPEGAPIQRMSVSAEKSSYKIKTYGAIISITRQMIINDDFGMVESAARQRGRSAAETERKVVWDYILGNPTAQDGNPVFDDTNHGNYPTADAEPVSARVLSAARLALRTMLSPDGFAVNGLLKHVVVAPGGETLFDQLLNGAYMPTAPEDAITRTLRNVQLHVEPLIHDSKANWIGFTDYAQCDHFEYAYLAGSEGPRVEQRTNFETECLDLKVALDFGVGAVDWRGVYYVREQ